MSVIIRLQNLPWAANAADIRQYFQGLSIPEGGVHIVGGEKGDAFISFSTDEDARQAMLSDRGCIKDVQIRLLLSSRNEMQKVIESARQQAIISHVYMQQMQQPQLPIVGSLPPLTAKVLPQPQQQQVRPDRMIGLMHRAQQPVGMDVTAVLMSQDKQQLMQHLSPKSLDNKDREDKGYKRERTRSKSRERRSKSSRNNSGRRDRSRSRDRRRRDRSRGRDRSRDKHHENSRNSSSRSSGGDKPHRSRSPGFRSGSADGGKPVTDQQPQSANAPRSYSYQYDGVQQMQQQTQAAMNVGDGAGSMFSQFRTPPQPPIIHPNVYQPQSQKPPAGGEWGGPATQAGADERQPPYVPGDNYRGSDAFGDGGGSDDDEDDRRRPSGYGNAHQRRYNDGAGGPAARRGPPTGQQDYRCGDQQQHGFGGGGRGPRFPKQQQAALGPSQNRGNRPFGDFNPGGGPRFNGQPQQQQQPRYRMGAGDGDRGTSDGNGGRPSRFSSVHEGGRQSRFNPAPTPQQDGDFDESTGKRPPVQPQRFNDRYRYDVRNATQSTLVTAAPPGRSDGLCVEVNNMPNHFSYGDVRKLFDGIHIDGSAIKIQKHRQGVVFVRFDNNHNKNLAMRLTGTAYKGSQVVVKHLDDEAYERENTDDRPYPTTTAAAVPTIVDHVDLVDDDEDAGGNEPKPSVADGGSGGGKQQNADDRSVDGGNLVVCEKGGVKDAGTEGGGDGAGKSSSEQPSSDPPTKYLKLKQLPITVTEDDVLNEFDGGNDVRRVTFYPDGEFLGASLEFYTVEIAEAALKKFDCVLLGSTPVPVLRCSYKEYAQIKRKAGVGGGGGGVGGGGGGGKRFSGDGGGRHQHHHHHHHQLQHPPGGQSSQQPNMPIPPNVRGSNCLYLYGLPTTVTNTDITQFFSDISVLPDKIHIMLSKFGRPTGESYCEFGTAAQAHAALSKDQCYMGPNPVYVEPISRSDMIQAITKPMQQRNHPQQDMSWSGGGGMRGGPPRQQQHNNVMMQSSPRHQGPSSYGGGGGGGGGGHNGAYGGGNGGNRFMNSGGGRGGYAPRMRGPSGPGPNAGPNTGPDGFGQPGCVVALDNVPYRADVQEIVDFFEGFELNCQNVIRRFNDFGKPTGEARVNLRNPQEAMRAVRVLQNKPIFNRPVCLTLL